MEQKEPKETREKFGNTNKLFPSKPKQETQKLHWGFTLNNYEPIEISFLLENIHLFENYVFQEEIGEDTKTPHIQGYFKLIKKDRMSALKKWFGDRYHWEAVRNVDAYVRYCFKETTRKPDGMRWTNMETPMKKIIKTMIYTPIEEFYDWQKIAYRMINDPADNRTIHWFYNKEGNCGKSTFCRTLGILENIITMRNSKTDDLMSFLIKNNIELEKALIFDMPRGSKINYNFLEQIKDGYIFSTKYEGGFKFINPIHIFVFSNEMPELNKLTEDRLVVWTINPDYSLSVSVNLGEQQQQDDNEII